MALKPMQQRGRVHAAGTGTPKNSYLGDWGFYGVVHCFFWSSSISSTITSKPQHALVSSADATTNWEARIGSLPHAIKQQQCRPQQWRLCS